MQPNPHRRAPRALLLVLLLASGCAANAPAVRIASASVPEPYAPPGERGPRGNVSFFVGQRTVDDWDSEPTGFGDTVDLSEHTSFGVDFATISSSGFGFEAQLAYSQGEDDTVAMGVPIDLELSMIELGVGARYTFTELGALYPYVGAGLELIAADLEAASSGVAVSADDTDTGVYAHAGVLVPLGPLTVGIDLRTLSGTDNDLDSTQVAATLGFGF